MLTFKIIILTLSGIPILWESLDRQRILKRLEEQKNNYPNNQIYTYEMFKKDIKYQTGMLLFSSYIDPSTLTWISDFLSKEGDYD